MTRAPWHMSERYEHAYPYAWSIVLGAGSFMLFRQTVPSALHELLGSVVSVSSIAVGFLATAKAILISLDGKPVVARMKQTKAYENVIGYSMAAINSAFVLAGLSALGLLADLREPARWLPFAAAAWVTLLVASTLLYYRVVATFGKILRNLHITP